jgi:hypothetical protein
MPGTAADAYEDDLYGAANRARVPFEDMAELVACLEAAHSVHPEWTAGARADIIQVAVGIEASGNGQPGRQEGAMAFCHLLRDLP